MKYNFSVKKGEMTFSVDGCDSFEEAVKKVERGVYDYELKNGPITTSDPSIMWSKMILANGQDSTYVGPTWGNTPASTPIPGPNPIEEPAEIAKENAEQQNPNPDPIPNPDNQSEVLDK